MCDKTRTSTEAKMTTEPTWCARGCYAYDRHLADCEGTGWHTPACVDAACPGCNDQRCDGCQPREAAEGNLCESCCRVLGSLLAGPDEVTNGRPVESITYVTRWLAEQLHNPIRCNLGKSGRGSGEDDAFVRVFAALTDLQIAWAELAVDFLGGVDARPVIDRNPAAISARLRPFARQLCAWEPIADTIDYLIELRDAAHAVAPWRTRDRSCDGVQCPACGRQELRIPAGEVDVWCSCGAVHGREVYDRLAALAAWEARAGQRIAAAALGEAALGTLEELARALDVPWGTLRRWKHLGWLPAPTGRRGRAAVYDAQTIAAVAARIQNAAA